MGYHHIVVAHERGFGRGIATTNHIESLWSLLKRYGRFNKGCNYTNVAEVQEALDETSWRLDCHKRNIPLAQDLARILRLTSPI